MTESDMSKHVSVMLTADKIVPTDMSEHADRAVALGMAEFWGAHNWTFRRSEDELSIDSSAEVYDLPDDFDSIVDIREKDSNRGFKMQRYTKERFDQMIPKLSAHNPGNPQIFAIFRDADLKMKITFFPQPSASTTFYVGYHLKIPSALSSIPDKMHGGVLAFALKNAYPPGGFGYSNVVSMLRNDMARLITTDKLSSAAVMRMRDGTEDTVRKIYEWVPFGYGGYDY